MREHGVIRRVLVVYREASARLRSKPASVPPDALQKAAKLMRSFGEDYHEKQLEEAHIFPALTKAGPLVSMVN
jgi:hemerythrin-like domain-containing protein